MGASLQISSVGASQSCLGCLVKLYYECIIKLPLGSASLGRSLGCFIKAPLGYFVKLLRGLLQSKYACLCVYVQYIYSTTAYFWSLA